MPPTVLIAEDVHDIALWLKTVLSIEIGGNVRVYTDSFDLLLEDPPWQGVDVAVVDLMLRDIDGIRILEWLSDHHPNIRRVVFTAASVAAVEIPQQYADAILLKGGTTISQLVEAVTNAR